MAPLELTEEIKREIGQVHTLFHCTCRSFLIVFLCFRAAFCSGIPRIHAVRRDQDTYPGVSRWECHSDETQYTKYVFLAMQSDPEQGLMLALDRRCADAAARAGPAGTCARGRAGTPDANRDRPGEWYVQEKCSKQPNLIQILR